MTNEESVYTFANGIRVLRKHLIPVQIERYALPESNNLHEPEEEGWFNRVFDESENGIGVFLDIGAAIGYYSILVRKRFPDAALFAVDPLPLHVDAFWKTLDLNDIAREHVHHMANAIAASAGTVEFALNNYSSHIVSPATWLTWLRQLVTPQEETIQVLSLTLAEILDRIGRPVDLAKMDIQGAEMSVLSSSKEALRTGKVRTWIIGTHSAEIHRNCLGIMAECYDIMYENQTPKGQIDGIIVGRFRQGNSAKAVS